MTTGDRNFRSSYYEKVGCYSVEEKKSLNKLLQDKIRNHSKLKQFCLSYTVPTSQRAMLWSIILGILPLHKDSTDYILEQRHAVYEDLMRAVTVMQYIDSSTTKSQVLHKMWLLENNRLLHTKISQEDDYHFIEIVKVLLEIFDDDVETYWIAKEFFLYSKEIQRECPKLKEITQMLLKREDITLHNHFLKLDLFGTDSILDKWYSICFAGVLSETVLVKIWDKVCGGSRKIVIFIFLEIIKIFREIILNSCNSQDDIKALVQQIKDQDDAIVNKAIKTWQSNKNPSEITVH